MGSAFSIALQFILIILGAVLADQLRKLRDKQKENLDINLKVSLQMKDIQAVIKKNEEHSVEIKSINVKHLEHEKRLIRIEEWKEIQK